MLQWHGEYELSGDRLRLDLERVHSWLTESYWNKGCSLEYVTRAFEGSRTVVGAYLRAEQVGCLRVVSDGTTFAWVADVYVAEAHRGMGLSKAMVSFVLEHPDYEGLKRWLLATKDAHGVYASLGFEPLPNPEAYMVRGKVKLD